MTSTNLTIGTDPELVICDQSNKLVRASDVIDNTKDKFGVDGHIFIAELRPPPAVYPRDLVSHVKEVLASRAEQLRDYKWHAGPWLHKKPLGGHIHFGIPFEDHFLDALDHQLAILLALVEPPAEAALRRTTNPSAIGLHRSDGDEPYGKLGDMRRKTWGFEYRTPSSYITSPGVTLGILTAAKALIWEEIQGGSQAYSKLKKSDREALSFTPEDFHRCDRSVFLPKLEALKKQFAAMRYFEKNQEGANLWPSVAYLLNKVAEAGGYSFKNDIKGRWDLQPTPKAVVPEPQAFWQTLMLNNHNWWLENPLETAQTQFVLSNPGKPLVEEIKDAGGAVVGHQWNWVRADPDTIWEGLSL